MLNEIIGFRFWDIKARKDGEKDVCGYSVWFACDEVDEEFQGRSAVKIFFPADRYPAFVPVLGDKYSLYYDHKGKFRGMQRWSE